MKMRVYLSALVAFVGVSLAFTAVVEAAADVASTQPLRLFSRANVSVRYPSSWHLRTQRLDQVIDPHTLFVVSSYAVPQGPSETTHVPGYARGLPVNGAFILVTEILDGASLKRSLPRLHPKPRHFVLPKHSSGGCLRCSSITFQFRVRSRAFYIYVTLGPRTSARTREASKAVLDSLAVARN